MTDYGDYTYQDRRDRPPPWLWIIGGFAVVAVCLAVFLAIDTRPAAPERITPIPSASQTMTVTETPATVTETPPVTLTETKTETSPTTVVVTRTEPVTTTVTVTP